MFVSRMFTGDLTQKAYAAGAADEQITEGLKTELKSGDTVTRKAGVIEARIKKDNVDTVNMLLPESRRVEVPAESSDEGLLGALAQAASNFLDWITGGDDSEDTPTTAAVSFSNLEEPITWSTTSSYRSGSDTCLLYTSPSPRDRQKSRMPSSA